MKNKYLFNVLIVVVILLLYNVFCYSVVKKIVYNGTYNQITNYFKNLCVDCNYSYKIKNAINNSDNSISVYVELENNENLKDYYHFRFFKNGNLYTLIESNTDIPVYVKY